MNSSRMKNWLKNIFQTEMQEISCSQCFDLVSQYVDVELTGEDAAAAMPQVHQHLGQCPACREEYETLRELQRMDNEGRTPSIDEMKDSIP